MRNVPLDSPDIDEKSVTAWERHIGKRVSDPPMLRSQLAGGTLPGAIFDSARRHSRLPALTISGRTVSHGEVDDGAGRAAAHLASLGVTRGERVMLLAAVGIDEIFAYLGAMRLGATIVLVNPTLTASEMAELASVSEPGVLVGRGAPLEVASRMEARGIREIIGLRHEDRGESTTPVMQLAEGSWPVQPLDPKSVAILAFTSGTTGQSKPTPLTHSALIASIRGAMMAWRWTPEDHLVHSLPISHQHGLSGVHATLLAGSKATLLGHLDAEALLNTVSKDEATIHFGVAGIHQRLLDRLGGRASGLSRLRLAVSGSGPLPVGLYRRYESVTGHALLERYGTTESGLNVSNPYRGPRLAGHVGLPLPGVEMALLSDDGRMTDRKGEVLLRGPQVFGGYLGVPASDQPFFGDWFRTGDIGTLHEKTGFLRIVGRSKEVIISGGMNVYPREVEDAILAFPDVTDVAVSSVASKSWGEEVIAVVSPSSLDTSELREFLRTRLAGYKRPKRILTAEAIPRNHVGKVVHSDLVKMFLSDDSAVPPDGI
ncbi:MAG: AMP-binding protein [Acidimicrobiia bacterium]|nr:AMP-binding protein [Acidimicrobiia bacterium]